MQPTYLLKWICHNPDGHLSIPLVYNDWSLPRTWLFMNIDLNLLGVLPAVVKGISLVHFKVGKGFDSCFI